MNQVPSSILLLLCISAMFVFMEGVFCLVFDISNWAVKKLEPATATANTAHRSDRFLSANPNTVRCLAILLLCAVPAVHISHYRPLTILYLLLAIGVVYIFAKGLYYCWIRFVIWFRRLDE